MNKLHAHLTCLHPGAGYPEHDDPYDVAMLTFDGTVETLGQEVGPYSVIFFAAGEPHGMKNVGTSPAVYLVFEFHGSRKDFSAGQGSKFGDWIPPFTCLSSHLNRFLKRL